MDTRRPSALPLLLLAVVLLAGGAVYVLLTPEEDAGLEHVGGLGEPGADAGPADDLLTGGADDDAGARSTETAPTPAAPTEGGEELWLEGRVAIPEDAPADPTLEVVVLADRTDHKDLVHALHGFDAEGPFRELDASAGDGTDRVRRRILARGPVAEDGTFRLGLSGPRRQVFAAVEGRYLYLDEARPVRFEGAETEPVVLTPELGAWIEGRVVLEGGSAAGDPAGAFAGLIPKQADLGPGAGGGDRFGARVRVSDRRVSFRAVPVGAYEVGAVGPSLPATLVDLPPFTAGQHVEFDLRVPEGAVLSGHVTDGGGRPVAGARVVAWLPGKVFGFDDRPARWADTDAQGRFELAHVPVRELKLSADHADYLESVKQLVEVPPSKRLENLSVKLEQPGRSVTGRLRWPDGSPAAGIDLQADFDLAYMAGPSAMGATRGARADARSDGEGRFELRGLGAGPFVVRARAEGRDGVERRHTARADAVRPGSDLELVLRPGIGIAGRVVLGEEQEPVTSFTLVAARLQEGDMISFHLDRRRQDVVDAEGRFVVEDLTAGHWDLWVEGDGVLSPEALTVELPQADGEELLVTVVRTAQVTGRVVSARGQPVGGAQVTLDSGAGQTLQDRVDPAPFRPEAHSDEEGAFELESLPGDVALVATADGHGKSAPVPLSLAEESLTEDVELRLTQGGVLAGEVLDKDGNPAAGRMVAANQMTDFQNRTEVTGADGTFRMENLTPGTWQVVAMDLNSSMGGVGEDGNLDMAAFMENMEISQATVVEGEETWITLGALPENPVRVHGRVTHGDEPYAGAMVSFYPEGARLYERLVMGNVDDDGRYEVELEQPGNYVVNVQVLPGGIGQQSTVEYAREVPAVEEHRLDLQIPLGRISGTVVGPEGRPAAGQRVSLTSDGVTRSDSIFGGQYAEVLTNAAGGFDLEGLRPGTYRVSAGGAPIFGGGGSDALGRVTRGDVKVGEDEWVQGLTLELPAPGSVEVTVVDAAGVPVSGASVFLRDASGRMLEPFTMNQTDGQGKLHYRGVAPGMYTAAARSTTVAAAEGEPFRVPEGDRAKVTLRAEPGTILWIQLLNAEGDPSKAQISVTDRDGREMSGMFGMQDLQSLYMEGEFSPTEHRMGPLPAGRYRVNVRIGGEEESKLVVLRGEPEKRLTVRVR